MKEKRFAEEQIAYALRQAKASSSRACKRGLRARPQKDSLSLYSP